MPINNRYNSKKYLFELSRVYLYFHIFSTHDENGNNIMSLSGRQFINENSIAIVGSVLSTWPKRITPKGSWFSFWFKGFLEWPDSTRTIVFKKPVLLKWEEKLHLHSLSTFNSPNNIIKACFRTKDNFSLRFVELILKFS